MYFLLVSYVSAALALKNPSKFKPKLAINGNTLEEVDETKLLGLIIRIDIRWSSNTNNMVKKASKMLWLLRRLKSLGASSEGLIEVYIPCCGQELWLCLTGHLGKSQVR